MFRVAMTNGAAATGFSTHSSPCDKDGAGLGLGLRGRLLLLLLGSRSLERSSSESTDRRRRSLRSRSFRARLRSFRSRRRRSDSDSEESEGVSERSRLDFLRDEPRSGDLQVQIRTGNWHGYQPHTVRVQVLSEKTARWSACSFPSAPSDCTWH